MPSDWSRHSVYSERKLPRQKRSLPIYGEREDANKYWHCWNCGFVCNIQRDTLDTGAHATAGVSVGTFTDTDGSTHYVTTITGGCPFCGTRNWK
jgi:rubrerythrin